MGEWTTGESKYWSSGLGRVSGVVTNEKGVTREVTDSLASAVSARRWRGDWKTRTLEGGVAGVGSCCNSGNGRDGNLNWLGSRSLY